jgi:hypothetical protein
VNELPPGYIVIIDKDRELPKGWVNCDGENNSPDLREMPCEIGRYLPFNCKYIMKEIKGTAVISEEELQAIEEVMTETFPLKAQWDLVYRLKNEVRRLREQVLSLDDALEEYDCGHDDRTNRLIALGKAVDARLDYGEALARCYNTESQPDWWYVIDVARQRVSRTSGAFGALEALQAPKETA